MITPRYQESAWSYLFKSLPWISTAVFLTCNCSSYLPSLLIAASNLSYNQKTKLIHLWAKWMWRGSAKHLRGFLVGEVHDLQRLDFMNIALLLRGLCVSNQVLSHVSHGWKRLPKKKKDCSETQDKNVSLECTWIGGFHELLLKKNYELFPWKNKYCFS